MGWPIPPQSLCRSVHIKGDMGVKVVSSGTILQWISMQDIHGLAYRTTDEKRRWWRLDLQLCAKPDRKCLSRCDLADLPFTPMHACMPFMLDFASWLACQADNRLSTKDTEKTHWHWQPMHYTHSLLLNKFESLILAYNRCSRNHRTTDISYSVPLLSVVMTKHTKV